MIVRCSSLLVRRQRVVGVEYHQAPFGDNFRFFQRLTGDVRPVAEEGSPVAQQLCFEEQACKAPLVALDWTQRGDGLLCADLVGGVTMYQLRLPQSMQPLNSAPSGRPHTKHQQGGYTCS